MALLPGAVPCSSTSAESPAAVTPPTWYVCRQIAQHSGLRAFKPMRSEHFERLYEQHAPALLAFLVYRTGDRMLAEDLLADTFERVLRSQRRFDPRRGSEKTWLYTIALNLARDNARRASAAQRAVERVEVPPVEMTTAGFDAVEDRELLQAALASLTAEEREAIALRYGADLSVPEMAKVLGEKLSTMEGRLYRALRKLRAELE